MRAIKRRETGSSKGETGRKKMETGGERGDREGRNGRRDREKVKRFGGHMPLFFTFFIFPYTIHYRTWYSRFTSHNLI